jgi:pimeloyl-ACP methyl ester carboxylesterase
MSRRLAPWMLVLALIAAAACSDDSGSASPPAGPAEDATTTTVVALQELPAGEDLYALAEDIEPGEPGDVIAVQEVEGLDVDGSVLRVLYHSESLEGDDIPVSGIIIVPSGEAPEGGRPVLSWAHGTTGIADECAPSKDPEANGIGIVGPFLERGMVFVATDYEGLGTPGRHPYIVGTSEGRGTLDIVRAAQQLGDRTGAGEQVVIWGHSQGGHAALFANQIAEEWAPELEVVGTVAGAPPSQLNLIAVALRDSPFRFYLGMAAAGWEAAFPDADPALVLTPLGLERLEMVDEGCSGELATAWNDLPYEDLVKADPATVEPWASLLVENDPGFVVGESPVLIIHGEADEQIPVVSSELLLARMCDIGQVVERRTYPDQSHAGVIGPSLPAMLEWIDARLAGDPDVPTSC